MLDVYGEYLCQTCYVVLNEEPVRYLDIVWFYPGVRDSIWLFMWSLGTFSFLLQPNGTCTVFLCGNPEQIKGVFNHA